MIKRLNSSVQRTAGKPTEIYRLSDHNQGGIEVKLKAYDF